jgi:hypothetical protein
MTEKRVLPMNAIVTDSFDAAMASEFGPESDQEFLPTAADIQREQDGGVFTSRWMVYDREFPDGQREICASKWVSHNKLGKPINRARRGESESREANVKDASKRARQAVRHRCKTLGADRMITLTYRENMQDMGRLQKHFDAFRRRMGKAVGFQYVATIEKQERGAYHVHIAVRGRLVYALVRSIWQSIVGKDGQGRQMGQVNVRDPHRFGFGKNGAHKLAGYIAKYIGKEVCDQELNKKRYWSSRGIVVPEKKYYQLPYGTTEAEAYTHVLRLAVEANNDGMVFFSNSGLGVCWVATPPRVRCAAS